MAGRETRDGPAFKSAPGEMFIREAGNGEKLKTAVTISVYERDERYSE